MKKITLMAALVFMGMGAIAQNNGKGNGKANKSNNGKNEKVDVTGRQKGNTKAKDRRWDDDDDRNGRYENNRGNQGNGKYSKNVPTRVHQAFYNDYPNARDVSWTKNRGTWTAHFDGGLFGGTRSATYHANGNRIGTNNGGVFERRNDTRRDRTGGVYTDRDNDNRTDRKKENDKVDVTGRKKSGTTTTTKTKKSEKVDVTGRKKDNR